MIAALDLAPWRRRGESIAAAALRADPDAAGDLVSLDEADGVLMSLDVYDDDTCDAALIAAGVAPTREHRDAVRVAVREGYTQRMERRG